MLLICQRSCTSSVSQYISGFFKAKCSRIKASIKSTVESKSCEEKTNTSENLLFPMRSIATALTFLFHFFSVLFTKYFFSRTKSKTTIFFYFVQLISDVTNSLATEDDRKKHEIAIIDGVGKDVK